MDDINERKKKEENIIERVQRLEKAVEPIVDQILPKSGDVKKKKKSKKHKSTSKYDKHKSSFIQDEVPVSLLDVIEDSATGVIQSIPIDTKQELVPLPEIVEVDTPAVLDLSTQTLIDILYTLVTEQINVLALTKATLQAYVSEAAVKGSNRKKRGTPLNADGTPKKRKLTGYQRWYQEQKLKQPNLAFKEAGQLWAVLPENEKVRYKELAAKSEDP